MVATLIIGLVVIKLVNPAIPCGTTPGEALRIFVDTIVYWYVGIGGGFIFISALVALVWRDTRAELVSQILNATGTMIAAYGAILAVDQWRQALVGF